MNVYGAITSRRDRLVLVMELLAGGDLRTFLKKAEEPFPEEQARRIMRDVCAGMAFLHGKNTIHGDLKSANVLFDGAGRAKVRHGEVRWFRFARPSAVATRSICISKLSSTSTVDRIVRDLRAVPSSRGCFLLLVNAQPLPCAGGGKPASYCVRTLLLAMQLRSRRCAVLMSTQ